MADVRSGTDSKIRGNTERVCVEIGPLRMYNDVARCSKDGVCGARLTQRPSKLECKPAADFPPSLVTGPEQGLSNTEVPSLVPVVHRFPRYKIHGGWSTEFIFKCKPVVR